MAGGKGSRLGPLTDRMPKALLPLGRGTLIGQLLDLLCTQGATEFVLSIGPANRGPVFDAAIGAMWRGIPVRYVVEDQPMGTAGSLSLVNGLAPHFLVVNCDIVTTLDFAALLGDHLSTNAAATVATRVWTKRLRFGSVSVSDDGRITALEEKPTLRHDIVLGAYAFDRSAIAPILSAPPKPRDMPDLLTALIEAGLDVRRFHSTADWQDVGTPADYVRACGQAGEGP